MPQASNLSQFGQKLAEISVTCTYSFLTLSRNIFETEAPENFSVMAGIGSRSRGAFCYAFPHIVRTVPIILQWLKLSHNYSGRDVLPRIGTKLKPNHMQNNPKVANFFCFLMPRLRFRYLELGFAFFFLQIRSQELTLTLLAVEHIIKHWNASSQSNRIWHLTILKLRRLKAGFCNSPA